MKLCEKCKAGFDDSFDVCIYCEIRLTQLVLDKVIQEDVIMIPKHGCPFCKSLIYEDASKCPHCQSELGVSGVLGAVSGVAGSLAALALIFLVLVCFLIGGCSTAYAEVYIDLERIAQIESSGNTMAYNQSSGARGLYQITKPCLTDYMVNTGIDYSMDDMYDPQKSARVANWYINERIPELLRYFDVPDTIDNRLWAYNAGIRALKRKIKPSETRAYIKKYHKGDK